MLEVEIGNINLLKLVKFCIQYANVANLISVEFLVIHFVVLHRFEGEQMKTFSLTVVVDLLYPPVLLPVQEILLLKEILLHQGTCLRNRSHSTEGVK